MLLKVCGATSRGDVDLLHAAGVDLAGLWYGVAGGPAELTLDQLTALAGACRDTGGVEPVLVTFQMDAAALVGAARQAGIGWLQLHGYQPPAVVGALKRSAPELTVVKVLHVQGADCVERPLLGAYERAGTDLFLLDATSDSGQVGSTGRTLDRAVVIDLAEAMMRPFLLAGGISAETRPRFDAVVAHPLFAGVDVDTAARDRAGSFDAGQVRAIRQRWPVASPVPEGAR